MDTEAAHADLLRALNVADPDRTGADSRAAREVLIDHGAAALALRRDAVSSLDDVIRRAAEAETTPRLREFAVLLVRVAGVAGLLPTRGEVERQVRSLLERVLLNPLRRAGYPFDGTPYDKREALARLSATIDEHLHAPEPSIPRWLHGPHPRDGD